MPSILFVCTGNIHRSPMAEAIFKDFVEQQGVSENWEISSAGTWTKDGLPTTQEVVDVLKELGVAIERHASKQISREIFDESDLVLVMSQNHKEALCAEFPHGKHKVYLLSEMIGEKMDVEDPIGGTMEDFREAAHDIREYLTKGYKRINELAISLNDKKDIESGEEPK